MKTSFSGKDFAKALAEGSLRPQVTLEGMTRCGNDSEHILFSPGTLRQEWTPIPVEIVDEVKLLKVIPGDGQNRSHNFVRITLANTSRGALQKSLMSLLQVYANQLSSSSTPRAVGATVIFTIDTISGGGTFDFTAYARGSLVQSDGNSGGGATTFNASNTIPDVSSNGFPVSIVITVPERLESGMWDVWATSNVSGPAGPCRVHLPGIARLGVDGDEPWHC